MAYEYNNIYGVIRQETIWINRIGRYFYKINYKKCLKQNSNLQSIPENERIRDKLLLKINSKVFIVFIKNSLS